MKKILALFALALASCAPIPVNQRYIDNVILSRKLDNGGEEVLNSKQLEIGDEEKETTLDDIINRVAPVNDERREKILQGKKDVVVEETISVALLTGNPDQNIIRILENALDSLKKTGFDKTDSSLAIPKQKSDLYYGLGVRINIVLDSMYARSYNVALGGIQESFYERFKTNRPFYFNFGYGIDFRNDKYTSGDIRKEPMTISLNATLPSTLMSLATLYYMRHLTNPTMHNIIQSLNSLKRVFGRGLLQKEILIVDEAWRQKQLIAAHALAYTWMRDYGKKTLGMSPDDINRIHIYPSVFAKPIEKALSMGIDGFIRVYHEKPQLIFN